MRELTDEIGEVPFPLIAGKTQRHITRVTTDFADRGYPMTLCWDLVWGTSRAYAARYVDECIRDGTNEVRRNEAYQQYAGSMAERRREAGDKAADRVRQQAIRSHPPVRAYSEPSGPGGGNVMTYPPAVEHIIRTEIREAREAAEAAFDKASPTLDQATWERKHFKP